MLFVKLSQFAAYILMLSALVFASLGCGSRYSSQASEYIAQSDEIPECNQEFTYTSGVILTGSASFYKRGTELVTQSVSGARKLKSMILGDPIATALPIQNAEIAVYNQDLKLVQCGLTDQTGQLKDLSGSGDLYIPNSAGTYTIRVLARSHYQYSGPNDVLNVSIKKDIYKNEVHAIQTQTYSNGTSAQSVTLKAYARQTDSMEIEGGAFNILNNVQQAFDYIKLNTAGVDTTCLSNRINIYWKAGFNPMQYLNPNSDPATLANTSFYDSAEDKLFISGGQLGDISLSNTDHFDDFATVHELGHYIEKHCGLYTSPGGTHAIVVRIDPRLAWSEGWANYFATQVLSDRMSYLDPTMASKLTYANESSGWTFFFNSSGFSDSYQNISNGLGFMIDFKRPGTDPGTYEFEPYTGRSFDIVQPNLYPSEGHTREGAISRGLFKITNACGTNCTATPTTFEEIWKGFDQITGVGSPAVAVPYVSSFNVLQNMKSRVSWISANDTILNSEALSSDYSVAPSTTNWPGYGRKLGIGSCSLSIQPRTDDPALTGTNSDQRYSNHFYSLDPSTLSGLTSLSVTFTYVSGTRVDHDLLLFKPNYFFNDDYRCTSVAGDGTCSGTYVAQRTVTSDVVKYDRTSKVLTAPYTKTLSNLNTLSANTIYMLNIRAYTPNISIGSSTLYNYTINSNLGQLCPQ